MMRILVLSLITSGLFAVPSWYYKIDPPAANYYIGYGHGYNEAKAKSAALNDISKQISVTVDSTTSSLVHLKDDRLSDDFSSENRQTSNAKIYGYEMLEFERGEDGFYIALGYENIPSIDKFNRRLSSMAVEDSQTHNHYLKQTPIFKELQKKVDFSLKRQDAIWYIRYQEIFQALDERDFSHFFVTTLNSDLTINTNKRNDVLYEGDEFYFKITSQKDGFITIFTVYEDGSVGTLMRNIPIKSGRVENIPDKDFEAVLQAGLIESGVETFELYTVIYSEDEQYFDDFAKADEELITEERYKNFDELIKLLDDHLYVTLKVVTKPRS